MHGRRTNHNTWTGCVTDRDQDYDTKNTAPTSSATRFPAEEYVSGSDQYCKTGNHPYLQPIMPLSYDWSALKTTDRRHAADRRHQPGESAWHGRG